MRSLCRLPVAKNHKFGQILTFCGLLYRPPFTNEGQMWCAIAPMVHAYLPNFVSIGLFCCHLLAKNRIFPVFWTSAFSVVANWQQSDNVEHGCTTTNLSLSNGIKIVSVLQRLNGDIGRTISDVQKRDEQTDRQTNRQTDKKKTQRFWPPRRRVKSEPHQTWHGDRGPRERSFTSKSFHCLKYSFAARGR